MAVATDIKVITKQELKPPQKCNVVYHNDDYTTMEFVVSSLQEVFGYTYDYAHELTLKVHEHGTAIVGSFVYEIAEQKSVEVMKAARASGFPLKVTVQRP